MNSTNMLCMNGCRYPYIFFFAVHFRPRFSQVETWRWWSRTGTEAKKLGRVWHCRMRMGKFSLKLLENAGNYIMYIYIHIHYIYIYIRIWKIEVQNVWKSTNLDCLSFKDRGTCGQKLVSPCNVMWIRHEQKWKRLCLPRNWAIKLDRITICGI